MFPWVYGFSWSAGTVIFLGIFFSVVLLVGTTVATAALRARRDRKNREEERIRWHEDFYELPVSARTCRHVFSGEFRERVCERELDCRSCPDHGRILEHSAQAGRVSLVPQPRSPGCLELFGLRFPIQRKYHRGHTWVEESEDAGTVCVGLDEFARLLMVGDDAELLLPAVGTRLRVNGQAFRCRGEDGIELRVLSPVDGIVVDAERASHDWLLKVKLDETDGDMKHLLAGEEVRQWITHEVERFQGLIAKQTGSEAALTLADGGELAPGDLIRSREPGVDWAGVAGELLLEP